MPLGSGGCFWIRSAQALLLALAVCFSLGASEASMRFDNLGHRLMCTCGCAQLLAECDHIGCPSRGEELAELNSAIASGQSDDEILAAFSAKYGLTVLAAPPAQGFNLVAWIAPVAVFAAALLGTILLVRRWSSPAAVEPRPTVGDGRRPSLDPDDVERRARIRRETDLDGGLPS
jgi:cytochrome c-type biogenesis protein CcmH/NrfF